MLKWLERAMPYAAVPAENPLFVYDVRRIRWGQTAWHLMGYTFAVLGFVPFVLLGLWVLLLDDSLNTSPGSNVNIYDRRDQFMGLLLVMGIGANLMLDMVSLAAALDAVRADMGAGRYDVLRLTNLCAQQFVAARYTIAQVRAWRILALAISLRVSLVAFMMMRFELLPALFLLSGYVVVYLFEPVWRMRALTAIGVAIAARIHTTVYALVAAFTAMLAMWGVQAAIFMFVFGWLLRHGASALPVLVCFQPLMVIAAGWSFYTLCRGVQSWALCYATRHAFAPD